MSEPTAARPFAVHVADEVLQDLRERLGGRAGPTRSPGAGWRYGTDLAYLRELVEYWRDAYDWRAHEARLNAFRQFTVPLAGIDLTSSTSRAWARIRCRSCSRTAGRARSGSFTS